MRKQKFINYTTNVPVEKTLPEIERLLGRFGVTHSTREWKDGEVIGLVFSLRTGREEIFFRLPCNAEAVYQIIMQGYKRKRKSTEKTVREQSAKIAWRILFDSLAADLSRIELGQVKPEQLFFGQIINPQTGQTFFEIVEERGFKMLKAEN
jgi:hypothetical protein